MCIRDSYHDANLTVQPPAKNENRVVFMGDSITDSWAQPQFGGFFPGKPYIDRGISGQTTPQMLVRFGPDVIALQPKVVVILAGTNEMCIRDRNAIILLSGDHFGSYSAFSVAVRRRTEPSLIFNANRNPVQAGTCLLYTSALKGTGVEQLQAEILRHLPESEPYFPEDQVTDQPERFLAAEIIREKAIKVMYHEVPYALSVFVDKFEEKLKLLRIEATLNVERSSQKKILIGHKGEMLKKIGTEARKELEELFGMKVYLQTFVKVVPDWRESCLLYTSRCV